MERVHMKMKLHTLSKLGFILTFVLFAVAFGVSVIIGAFGPTAILRTTGESSNLASNWTGTITNLTKLHQQLILTLRIHNNKYQQIGYSQDVDFVLTIEGRTNSNNDIGKWEVVQFQQMHRQQIQCIQSQPLCKDFVVSREPFLHYNDYRYTISIIGLNDPKSPLNFIGNTTFIFSYLNDSFTVYELWFRFTFLVVNFLVIAYFFWNLRYFYWSDWSIEQKWVGVLLFALLAYNNPIFPISILTDGWLAPFLDVVFLVSFVCLLLFFWLILFDGMRIDSGNRTFLKFYLWKILLVGSLWIMAVTAFTLIEVIEVKDSAASITGLPYYLGFQVTIGVLLSIYVISLGFCVYGSLNAINQMPFLSIRLKFLGMFTLVVCVVLAIGITFGFVGPFQNSAAEFLSFLSLFNFYVMTLAFVYLPSGISHSGPDFEKRIGVARLEEDDDDDNNNQLISLGARKQLNKSGGTYVDLETNSRPEGFSETSSEAF